MALKKNRKKINKCGGLVCCMTPFDLNINWVLCSKCERWMHYFSNGISDMEDDIVVRSDYVCARCSGSVSTIDVMEAKLGALSDEQLRLKQVIAELQIECERQRSEIDEFISPHERRFLTSLNKLRVVLQAYHGNVYVGSHCKVILREYEELLEFVSGVPELHRKFKELFSIYSLVHRKVSSKRFLTSEEVTEVRQLSARFGEKFSVFFPEATISRKIYEFV